jgi:hypothetical protein
MEINIEKENPVGKNKENKKGEEKETENLKSKKAKAEEKQKQKNEKKLNKKVAKAIGIILHHENKKAEEIFTDEVSLNMFFYHFGNGDEEDQIKTKNYFEKNYGNDINVIIYPGISYGFIELKSMETAKKIIENQSNFNLGERINLNLNLNMEDIESIESIKNENLKKFVQKKKEEEDKVNNINNNINENNIHIEEKETLFKKIDRSKKGNPHSNTKIKIFYHDLLFENGERTIFTIFSKISSEEVKQKELCNVPNASLVNIDIPGLILINDFISEEEEINLIKDIDSNKWEKLTNRKVQHYGYEFIYGANIINKNKKIGELPSFCLNLTKSKKFFIYLFIF